MECETMSSTIDLYNVERVEALKGPNAMIFGAWRGACSIGHEGAGFTALRE